MWYSFDKPPHIVSDYIAYKSESLVKSGHECFHAGWDFGNFIYLLSKNVPGLRIIISIRDPLYACNSLLAFRPWVYKNNDAAIQYVVHYSRILSQIQLMKVKPWWIEFDDYVKGKYTKAFFKFFRIPDTRRNRKKATDFLTQKINSSGNYELIDSPHLFAAGREIIGEIKNECPEFR